MDIQDMDIQDMDIQDIQDIGNSCNTGHTVQDIHRSYRTLVQDTDI